MISKKSVFLIVSGLVVFVLVAAAAYFGTQTMQNGARESVGGKSEDKQKSAVFANPKKEVSGDSQKLVSDYPLERGVSGVLKSVDSAKGEIVVSGDKDQRVTVATTTEIFRNGKRAALADIKATDNVTVLGREKTKDSKLLIADSIYAADDPETPVSLEQ